MDANFILTLTIAVNCVLGAGLIASHRRKSTRGWLAVHGLILLSLGVGYLFVPDVIGFWGAGAYVVLVLLPALGASMIWRLLTRGSFARALDLARVLAMLHPLDGWQRYPDLVRMFHAMHAGDVELARTFKRHDLPVSLVVATDQMQTRMYTDLAAKHGTILYPNFVAGLKGAKDVIQDDGIHPNAAGVAKIVADIGPKVLELLARVGQ